MSQVIDLLQNVQGEVEGWSECLGIWTVHIAHWNEVEIEDIQFLCTIETNIQKGEE